MERDAVLVPAASVPPHLLRALLLGACASTNRASASATNDLQLAPLHEDKIPLANGAPPGFRVELVGKVAGLHLDRLHYTTGTYPAVDFTYTYR